MIVDEKITQSIAGDTRFRKLIEHSHEGISLLDSALNVTYRSRSGALINGWGDEKRMQAGFEELIHPEDLSSVRRILQQVLENPGVPVPCTFRSKHQKGYFIWLD